MEFKKLFDSFGNAGELVWIGVRTERGGPIVSVEEVFASVEQGLIGDRYQGKNKKRQVTLVQHEHLAVIESIIGRAVCPSDTRRNLVVRGINLFGLKKSRFCVGPVLLEVTGLCQPCSKMENNLGPGGFNAMRGHGGLTARIIEGGMLRQGDAVVPYQADLFTN